MSRSGILVLSALTLLLFGSVLLLHSLKSSASDKTNFLVPDSAIYVFPELNDQQPPTVLPDEVSVSWRKYENKNGSALAILLTDTASDWIGLVHGLKNIGVPFMITTDVDEAVKHSTVLAYPVISGKVLSAAELRLLAAVPRNGGTIVGVNVLGGGFNEVFGFDTLMASKSRNVISLEDSDNIATRILRKEKEGILRLTNKVDYPDAIVTNGYVGAKSPLMKFEDGTTFLAYKDYGTGKAYALGMDIGNYFLRYMNERGFNAYRNYANGFEPGMDILLRVIKEIYRHSSKATVTIGTVPFDKDFSLLITHDVDYTRSIINAARFAELEDSIGIKATYFIQTKYIKDWNDAIFFNKENLPYLTYLTEKGMEVGSHSVAHSKAFSSMPQGTGKESYPDYRPFVQDRTTVYNGSILGELRVSKFLLETLVPNAHVTSFRPGHLSYPFSLPQSLEATGYRYSSSVTANNVQTHLPFLTMYNRGSQAETKVLEIPVTIEDELGLPLLERLDKSIQLASDVSAYGGVVNVLIHTDQLGQKLAYERQLITALKPKAWIRTISSFGRWWTLRNEVTVDVEQIGENMKVTVINPSEESIEGLTLHVPSEMQLTNDNAGAVQKNRSIVFASLNAKSTTTLLLTKQ